MNVGAALLAALGKPAAPRDLYHATAAFTAGQTPPLLDSALLGA
jgi:hypothetical protein